MNTQRIKSNRYSYFRNKAYFFIFHYKNSFFYFRVIWLTAYQLLVGNYYLEYSDYWLHLYGYNHNFSADMSFGLLQVFHVELMSITQNLELNPYFKPQEKTVPILLKMIG